MDTGFEADFWKAPLLRFLDKFKDTQLLFFLKKLNLKFSADWITGLSFSKRIESVCNIIQLIDESNDSNEILTSQIFDINKQEYENAINSELYGKATCKYILLEINMLLQGNTTNFNPPSLISVEHILPQNPDATSQWVKDFDNQQRMDITNKLGNLMLISRRKNSSLSNSDYHQKKEKYFKNNVEVFSLSSKIYTQYQNWTMKEFNINHNEMVSLLKAEY